MARPKASVNLMSKANQATYLGRSSSGQVAAGADHLLKAEMGRREWGRVSYDRLLRSAKAERGIGSKKERERKERGRNREKRRKG